MKTTETLVWLQEYAKRPRSKCVAEIADTTRFFNEEGWEAAPPRYDASTGWFVSPEAVTGVMVLEYHN